MDRLFVCMSKAAEGKAQGGVAGQLKRAWWSAGAALTFARMYLLPVKSHALPQQVRLQPAW
jgi:magnesium-protoporphyrin IX monomethyl ester (oxidative) cyclase